MESGTHASAMGKTRYRDGYLCLAIVDASKTLDRKAADGRGTVKTQKIDLEIFVFAAHSAQNSHQTMDHKKSFQRGLARPTHLADPHVPPPPTEVRETTVVCALDVLG